MESNIYQYRPLEGSQAIRLIYISPGEGDEKVVCKIVHHTLQLAPSYEALSYTWGTEINKYKITVQDGVSGPSSLPVTVNCYSALLMLRQPNESRLVWVDAICIDQSNVVERNAQVALMAYIYNRAVHVIVDLGGSYEDSDLAFDIIPRLERTVGDGPGSNSAMVLS